MAQVVAAVWFRGGLWCGGYGIQLGIVSIDINIEMEPIKV